MVMSSQEGSSFNPPSTLSLFDSHVVAIAALQKARCEDQVSNLEQVTLPDSGSVSLENDQPSNCAAVELTHQSTNQENVLADDEPRASCSSSPRSNEVLSLVPQALVDDMLNANHNNANILLESKNEDFVEDEDIALSIDIDSQTETSHLLQDIPHSSSQVTPLEDDLDSSKANNFEKHSNWRKLADGDGSYYWNVDSGATQYETPNEIKNVISDDEQFDSLDSSLADLEGAAFRYASLHISDDTLTSHDDSSECTLSSGGGRMFSVRSLGWLPLDHFSANPETSSSEVNACIQHLSSSHAQFNDGIGAWGDGKDLMLLIEDEDLKLVDPSSQTVLQTQPIRHIRVWGVGGNSPHDFAYVAKDNVTRQYKCHVFRCDVSAKAIAQELHSSCKQLSCKSNKAKKTICEDIAKQELALTTDMPMPKSEPSSKFEVKYLGNLKVENVNGINTIKNVIREITTNDQALCEDSIATVSASALVINRKVNDQVIINCRMRCLSFMGIGDDISLFAFIHVVGSEATCHVVQCQPNAAKLASSIQEACVLRFQKAVDSKPASSQSQAQPQSRRSFKRYFKSIFSKKTS